MFMQFCIFMDIFDISAALTNESVVKWEITENEHSSSSPSL